MAIIFSKVLAPKDIECNLLIPITSFGNLAFGEGRLLNMIVYDVTSEREWRFCCTVDVRRNDEIMGDDRVLSVDWLDFARRKDLKPNDKVIFREEMDHAEHNVRLKVEVTRKIRLFGQDIWTQVP